MGEGTSVLASAHAVEKHSQNIFPPVCVVRVMRPRCGAEVRGEPINRSVSPTGALPAWLPPALGIHTLLALFPPQSPFAWEWKIVFWTTRLAKFQAQELILTLP